MGPIGELPGRGEDEEDQRGEAGREGEQSREGTGMRGGGSQMEEWQGDQKVRTA